MLDLHSHFLPKMDDGSKSIEMSMEMLREQKNQGVERIVFTPHFNFERIELGEFIKRREESFGKLKAAPGFDELGIKFKLGAEVYYTVSVAEQDLDALRFEGTDYVLIELPTKARPHGVKRAFGSIIAKGYTPILAHVERYGYYMSDPGELYELIDMGCLAHINADTLTSKTKLSGRVRYLIKKGLVQFICTDCHTMKWRAPDLASGFEALEKDYGEEYAELFSENAERIFDGRPVDLDDIKKPVKLFGRWI